MKLADFHHWAAPGTDFKFLLICFVTNRTNNEERSRYAPTDENNKTVCAVRDARVFFRCSAQVNNHKRFNPDILRVPAAYLMNFRNVFILEKIRVNEPATLGTLHVDVAQETCFYRRTCNQICDIPVSYRAILYLMFLQRDTRRSKNDDASWRCSGIAKGRRMLASRMRRRSLWCNGHRRLRTVRSASEYFSRYCSFRLKESRFAGVSGFQFRDKVPPRTDGEWELAFKRYISHPEYE